MEGLEQVSNLGALGEGAQEAFRKACEEQGVNQEAVQVAVNGLVDLCVYLVEQITEVFIALRDTLIENIAPALHTLSGQLQSIFRTEDLFFMVPPHIRHLAYNHPKARVRKKNWNRMWKIYERYIRNGTMDSNAHRE